MMPRSIRTRLMLWYFGVLALILVLFSAGGYLTMRRALIINLDESLQNRAFLAENLIRFDATGKPIVGLAENANDPNLDDKFERVFGADAVIIVDNSPVSSNVLSDDAALREGLAGQATTRTVGSGDLEFRVRTVPVFDGARVGAVLQVAQATSDLHDTLRSLLLVFGVGLAVALLLATAGGYWLATRALSPIDKLTTVAREISEQDLSRRLALDLPDDEVGRLASTFDGMIARLEAAFERQRQFTADASHELRTPLTAIRGQIDVALQRPRDGAEYTRTLGTINDQVERMSRLVAGLLMLARADGGNARPIRESIDMADLVHSVAEQARPAAEQRGLSVAVIDGPAAIVRGDEDLLLQLVLNLVDNAVKYTEQGVVTLAWRRNGDGCEIAVSDTGPGIPAEEQQRLFERFYRGETSRARQQGGTGLGLAIARSIAELHGGSLSVKSSPKGSTFTVRLPGS